MDASATSEEASAKRGHDTGASKYSISEDTTDVKQNFSVDDDAAEMDEAYLSAVESGDMETAQRMVDEAAERAGYTTRAYHQTENEFTEFDTHHKGAGTSDYMTPFGIFLKPSDENIGIRGNIQMPLFVSVNNPLTVSNRDDLLFHLQRDETYNRLYEEIQHRTHEYEQKLKVANDELMDYLKQWRKNNPNASRSELMESDVYKKSRRLIEEWTRLTDETTEKAKSRIVELLKEQEYDGVIIENDAGSFGRKTKAIVVLESWQVKTQQATEEPVEQ